MPGGLEAELFAVPGKVPLYLEGDDPDTMSESAGTVGVEITAQGARMHYIPGCALMTPALRARLAGPACVLFDGTLFTDDEMIRLGAGPKTGRRMGHMPMTGPGSTLEAFAAIPVARRIFVHVNNTNPALLSDSPERAHLAAAGWEVAEDGMEVRL